MQTRTTLLLCCIALGIGLPGSPTNALNRLAIDGIHGQQNLSGHLVGPYLPAVYPDSRFTYLGAERLPLVDVITEGVTTHAYWDSIYFDVAAGAEALYVIVTRETTIPPPPAYDYPFVTLTLPDESTVTGAYGFTHIDFPPAGQYLLYISHTEGVFPYQIGTGPCVWDVYPPDDYDAILDFHNDMYGYWTGLPPRRSGIDFAAIDAALQRGTGIGLFYDCSEPIADKPIIRMRGLAERGASVKIDVPGRLTYAVPEPESRFPLEWNIPPTTAEVELDYEVQLRHPLNFVWSIPGTGAVENQSWATVHDLKLISFEAGKGYRISEAVDLKPEATAGVAEGSFQSFSSAYAALDRMMRAEALKAGLTNEETESFFARCNWPHRILARVSAEPGQMALYYIDGKDYDALFPMVTDPYPADVKRVGWVHSFIPARITDAVSAQPKWAEPTARLAGAQGEYHEYGALRETYGGDALDDMDVWGWHFYDSPLVDETNIGVPFPEWGTWGSHIFHTPGASPLAGELLAGVNEVNGAFSGPISAAPGEVVLSGDEDTWCEEMMGPCPFPAGSYPPVVVGRTTPSGAHIIAAGDVAFLDTLADNVQLGRNIWNALHDTHTENVPDIDIPDAVVDIELIEGESGQSVMWVYNRGDAQLQTNFNPPQVEWFTVESSLPRSISANDSDGYTLLWSAEGLTPGYYFGSWTLITDDPNEDTLYWPVRLHVKSGSSADPNLPALPIRAELFDPFPNPFNPSTTLRFALPEAMMVSLVIYDIAGREVETLFSGMETAGEHVIKWDCSDCASGVYIARLRVPEHVLNRKMLLIR